MILKDGLHELSLVKKKKNARVNTRDEKSKTIVCKVTSTSICMFKKLL